MRIKKICVALLLCFSFIFFMTSSNFVYAQETGILNMTIEYENKAISGVEFSIYQVADLKEDKSRYMMIAPFKYDGDFRDIKTAEEHIKLALAFENQSRNLKALDKLQTGTDGKLSFTGLKEGMYLVVQTGAVEEAKNYTTFQSFLVMVPQFENGTWNKVVDAKPKTEVISKDKPKNPPENPPSNPQRKPRGSLPKTGDSSNIFCWSGILLISGGLLFVFEKKKRDKIGEMSK